MLWRREWWDGEAGGGTGSSVVEPGVQAMKPGALAMDQCVKWLKIGTRAGKPRTQAVESGAWTVVLDQAVESMTLTAN